MEKHCRNKHQKCGEFTDDIDDEMKLKHLKECKESLEKKIKDIDEAINRIEN